MIRYFVEMKDYLSIAKAHMSIYQTEKVKSSENDWKPVKETFLTPRNLKILFCF
jgi:hypothetical protein